MKIAGPVWDVSNVSIYINRWRVLLHCGSTHDAEVCDLRRFPKQQYVGVTNASGEAAFILGQTVEITIRPVEHIGASTAHVRKCSAERDIVNVRHRCAAGRSSESVLPVVEMLTFYGQVTA